MLTDADTKQIAGLIQIHIPEDQLPKYTEQLNTVLEAADVLKQVDTEGVETTSQTHGLTNVLREDEVEEGLDMQEYPNPQFKKTTNTFEVKQVIGGDSA